MQPLLRVAAWSMPMRLRSQMTAARASNSDSQVAEGCCAAVQCCVHALGVCSCGMDCAAVSHRQWECLQTAARTE